MHKAIPCRTWLSPESSAPGGSQPPPPADNVSTAAENETGGIRRKAKKLVSESAVIVFGRKGCFMCHVVRLLLVGHGVNPPIVEVEEADVAAVIDELSDVVVVDEVEEDGNISNDDLKGRRRRRLQFPAVFVGGKLFGGLERVVATHVSGELAPILRQAGALWL